MKFILLCLLGIFLGFLIGMSDEDLAEAGALLAVFSAFGLALAIASLF